MRSAPSEKALKATFDLTATEAKLIRALAKATDDGEVLEELVNTYLPQTERYVRSMYSNPYDSRMWRITVALSGINEILEGYGVEELGPSAVYRGAPAYEYINMGDTYAMTLIYDADKDRLFISTWGDVAERMPEEDGSW